MRTIPRYLAIALAALLAVACGGTIDPTLSVIAAPDGSIAVAGTFANEQSRKEAEDAFAKAMDQSKIGGEVSIGANRRVRQVDWSAKLAAIALIVVNIPSVEFRIEGKTITIDSAAPPAERTATAEKLKALFGPDYQLLTGGGKAPRVALPVTPPAPPPPPQVMVDPRGVVFAWSVQTFGDRQASQSLPANKATSIKVAGINCTLSASTNKAFKQGALTLKATMRTLTCPGTEIKASPNLIVEDNAAGCWYPEHGSIDLNQNYARHFALSRQNKSIGALMVSCKPVRKSGR